MEPLRHLKKGGTMSYRYVKCNLYCIVCLTSYIAILYIVPCALCDVELYL